MLNYIKNNNNFLILTWFLFFLSINLNPLEFSEFNYISKLRLSLPFLLFLILFILKFEFKKIHFKDNFSFLLFYLIFALYIFFNLLNSQNDNLNIFWPVYMLFSFYLITIFSTNENRKKIIYLSLWFIFLVYIIFFSQIIVKMLQNDFIHFYGIMGAERAYGIFISPPRTSGMARFSLLLFLFFVLHYFYSNKFKKLNLFIILFFATSCLIYHSRTISFTFYILNVVLIIFYLRFFISTKKLIIFTLIFPILINFGYNILLNKNPNSPLYLKHDNNVDILVNSIIRNQSNYARDDINTLSLEGFNTLSSGRLADWKKSIEIIKQKPLKGFGAQADRILIKQSVHNAILYATLSGGLIAGLSLIGIFLITILLLIKFYFFNFKNFNNNIEVHLSSGILIILGLRSILESGIAVFSVDYLLFIISFIILKNSLLKANLDRQ